MNLKNILYFILITIGLSPNALSAQNASSDMVNLNKIVEYSNHNVHGLFIIQRLLELYNQDINQYVDLDGYQLNAFGNDDLPFDIFEDPKREFYKRKAPLEIYNELIPIVSSEERKHLLNFHSICDKMNNLRWDVAEFMTKADFTESHNIGTVYEMLEKCVELFDNYYSSMKAYKRFLHNRDYSKQLNPDDRAFIIACRDMEIKIDAILNKFRNKNTSGLSQDVDKFQSNLESFKTHSTFINTSKANIDSRARIISRGNEFLKWVQTYINGETLPEAYVQYGKFYYYHNYKLLHRVNYSGVGMMYEMNELIKNNQINYPLFLETPHYFKVIYPERKASIEYIDDSEKEKVIKLEEAKIIYELPSSVRDRDVVVNEINISQNATKKLEFELYDHQLLDGDVVSINFNGDWILENHSLEATPIKLIVEANQEGKNYLLIHAVNEGSKSPNTVAVKYRPIKRKKEILLSCNTNTSQLIEINFN